MTKKLQENSKGQLNRRSLVLGLGGTLASVALFERAHGLESSDRIHSYDFRKESDFEGVIPYPNAHGGKGVIDVKYFFREDAA